MTIRDTLQSAYPDSQFMGTRRLGAVWGFVFLGMLMGW